MLQRGSFTLATLLALVGASAVPARGFLAVHDVAGLRDARQRGVPRRNFLDVDIPRARPV